MNKIIEKYSSKIIINKYNSYTLFTIENVNLNNPYEWQELSNYFVNYNYFLVSPLNDKSQIILKYYDDTKVFKIMVKNNIDKSFYLHIDRLIGHLISSKRERPLWCNATNNGFNKKKIEIPLKKKYFYNERNIYISININDVELINRLKLRQNIVKNYLDIQQDNSFHISLFRIYLDLDSEIIKRFSNHISVEINNIQTFMKNKLYNQLGINCSIPEEYLILGQQKKFFTLNFDKLSSDNWHLLIDLVHYIISCINKYSKKNESITLVEDGNNHLYINHNNKTIAYVESIYNYLTHNNNFKLHITIGKLRNLCIKKLIHMKNDNELNIFLKKKIYKKKLQPLIDNKVYILNSQNSEFKVIYQ